MAADGARRKLYSPLDVGRGEIRVLEVQRHFKPDGLSEVQYSLQTVALAPQWDDVQECFRHAPPFYALSYTWGSTAITTQILVDGHVVPVRENLALFLDALINYHYPRRNAPPHEPNFLCEPVLRLWADYLCINQDDTTEKSPQVALMGNIYRSAVSVCAWLGPSTPESDYWYDWTQTQDLLDRSTRRNVDMAGLQRMQDAINDVCNRHYWKRVWIVQEMILPSRLWFICGRRRLSRTSFLVAVRCCKRQLQSGALVPIAKVLPSVKNLDRRLGLKLEYTNGRIGLLGLLEHLAHAQCDDARDKIYGILAIVRRTHLIKIDYRKPLLQVLLDGLYACLSSRDNVGRILQALSGLLPKPFDLAHHMRTGDGLSYTYGRTHLRLPCHRAYADRERYLIAVANETNIVPAKNSTKLHGVPKVWITATSELSLCDLVYSTCAPHQESQWLTFNKSPSFFILQDGESGDHDPLWVTARGFRASDCAVRVLPSRQSFKQAFVHELCLPDPRSWLRHWIGGSSFTYREGDGTVEGGMDGFATILQTSLWVRNYDEQFKEAPAQEKTDKEARTDRSNRRPMIRRGPYQSSQKTDQAARTTCDQQQDENNWRPYDFGIQHELLDPCSSQKRIAAANGSKPTGISAMTPYAPSTAWIACRSASARSILQGACFVEAWISAIGT
ncbi:uncharacterized protein AB675_2794 [Cyphellophora attinorum]|uniref:Heterokaryon incompatibility domain-containing protein n=1 Tax=Cyphellophora attinorum TaxID=1664694 RepID=A0A0N0NRG5_9EURO|nr:uncharacterized protein AB675_2794 [Phialophora attinorum]KPI44819.1 hypothetical protein AB675_2794 [Phialophora attinorum]